MNNSDVSIIIPSYNAQKTILDTLRSALDQNNVSKQVIVVNDGSTDGTENILRESGLMREIEYIYQSNKGVSAARNNGLLHARGKYCCFLDSDDLLNPYFCVKMLHYMRKRNLKFAYSDYEYFLDDDCQHKIGLSYPKYEGNVQGKIICEHFIPTPSVMLERSIVHSIGFDEEISGGEDWLLWIRLLMQHRIGHLPERLALIRVRKDSLGRNKKRMNLELIKVMRKVEDLLLENKDKIKSKDHARFYLRYSGYLIATGQYRSAAKKWVVGNHFNFEFSSNIKILMKLILHFFRLETKVERILWRQRVYMTKR